MAAEPTTRTPPAKETILVAVRPAAPPGQKRMVYDIGGGKTVPEGDADALAGAFRAICQERAQKAPGGAGKIAFVVELQAERDAAWSAVAPVFKAVAEAKIPEMILVAGARRLSAPLPEVGRSSEKAQAHPLRIILRPAGKEGEGVLVKLGDREMGPTDLPGAMAALRERAGESQDGPPVVIQADGAVRWEHIVTTYHHVQERGFKWIGFAP
jgi:biopolymer transport protein ExbD